ncbi:hypothetical protein D3C78_1446140 [compost metagenome]
MRRASINSSRQHSAITASTGKLFAQVTPLSEPALHSPAVMADSSEALMISQVLPATSRARTAIPTIIKRNDSTPLRHASR